MQNASFHERPTARCIDTEVIRRGQDDLGPFVVLPDTVLYPEGGGQPRDYGTIDGIEVTGLRSVEDGFLHHLATAVLAESVEVVLDWSRRWDHMQQHTGQHLLSAVAQKGWNLATTSFHLGASVSDIELDGPDLGSDLLREIEATVASEIEAARPVTSRWLEPDELPESVRTRGLPAGHTGPLRLVEIEGLDCTTCGGTHVASTSEIGGLALLGAETMRGGSRVVFVAGGRWRERLARDEALLAGLRGHLRCRDEEMEALLEQRLAEVSALQRSLKAETGIVARQTAEDLACRDLPVVEARFENRDGGFLRQVASYLDPAATNQLFLLTSLKDRELFFLLLGSPQDARVADLGPRIAEILGGRGGGRGGSYQGKGSDAGGRGRALELLEASRRRD